jgi:hypothetical protein
LAEHHHSRRVSATRDRKQRNDASSNDSVRGALDAVDKSSGSPLDSHLRAHFEPRFGHSLDQIRIHADARAAAAAGGVGARAFTVGTDIAFNTDQYRPDGPEGHALLAHELTHAVQNERAQGSDPSLASLSSSDDRAEHEAEQAQGDAIGATALDAHASPSAMIARDTGDDRQLFTNQHVDSPAGQFGWDVLTDDFLGGVLGAPGLLSKNPLAKGLGKGVDALSPLSFFQGALDVTDALFGDNGTGEAVEKGTTGALNMFSGGASFAGLLGALPEVGGLMTMGEIGALGSGGVVAAGGQVAGAGLAGYEFGKIMDKGVGAIGGLVGGDERSLSKRIADRSRSVNNAVDDFFGNDTVGDIAGGIALGAQTLLSPAVAALDIVTDVGGAAVGAIGDALAPPTDAELVALADGNPVFEELPGMREIVSQARERQQNWEASQQVMSETTNDLMRRDVEELIAGPKTQTARVEFGKP